MRLAGSGALGNTAAPFTINGGVLDLNGFSSTVGLFSGGPGTILNNSGSGISTLTVGRLNPNNSNFNGTIADNDGIHTGGSVALKILGSGELTLGGTNTYSGGTTVGVVSTLNIINNSTIGTVTADVMAGVRLDNTSGGPVVLGNIPQTWNIGFQYVGGSLLNLGTGAVTVIGTGAMTLNVQNSSGTLEIDGNITLSSGTAQFATAGPGTVVFTGSNSISTLTTTNVASFAAGNTISTGTMILNGGNFTLQPSATFTVASGFFSATAAAGGVGTAIGNSGNASQTGYMVVSGGTYQQANDLFYVGQHSNGVLTIEGSGVMALGAAPLAFSYNGGPGTGTVLLNGGTLQALGFSSPFSTAGQTINFNGGVLELTANSPNLSGGTPSDFTLNIGDGGAFIHLDGYSTTISNALNASGSGGLTVTSASGGTLTLSGTNTYTGGTYVEGNSTLIATNNQAILDGTNLNVGSANELSMLGAVVPAETGSPAGSAIAARAAAVPEPGTLTLAAALLGGAAVYRRARRRNLRMSSDECRKNDESQLTKRTFDIYR